MEAWRQKKKLGCARTGARVGCLWRCVDLDVDVDVCVCVCVWFGGGGSSLG